MKNVLAVMPESSPSWQLLQKVLPPGAVCNRVDALPNNAQIIGQYGLIVVDKIPGLEQMGALLALSRHRITTYTLRSDLKGSDTDPDTVLRQIEEALSSP